MENNKLLNAAIWIWFVLSLPIANTLTRYHFDDSYTMALFAFIISNAPIWIFWGWRWLTTKAPPTKLVLLVLSGLFYLFVVIHRDIRYIPFVFLIAVLGFDYLFLGVTFPKIVKLISAYKKLNPKVKIAPILSIFVISILLILGVKLKSKNSINEVTNQYSADVEQIKAPEIQNTPNEPVLEKKENPVNEKTGSISSFFSEYLKMTDLQKEAYSNEFLLFDTATVTNVGKSRDRKASINLTAENKLGSKYCDVVTISGLIDTETAMKLNLNEKITFGGPIETIYKFGCEYSIGLSLIWIEKEKN